MVGGPGDASNHKGALMGDLRPMSDRVCCVLSMALTHVVLARDKGMVVERGRLFQTGFSLTVGMP